MYMYLRMYSYYIYRDSTDDSIKFILSPTYAECDAVS